MNKLQLIVLCNGGSQAYCANALLLNALIRKLIQNEAELFSAKGMHDMPGWCAFVRQIMKTLIKQQRTLYTTSDLQQNQKM